MHSAIIRLSALVSVGFMLGGCEDPALAPTGEQAALGSSATMTLGAPSDLKATAASPRQVDLTWKDNATNESGFEIHRSTTGAGGPFATPAGTGPNVTAYNDRDVTGEKEYCYRVRSFRTVGKKKTYTSFSNIACITTPGARPGAPTISVRPVWSFGVIVGWSDRADNEDGYRVQRSPGTAGPWVTVETRGPMVGLHSQEVIDVGLASEVQVCYRVVAFNSVGESASAIRCTVPPAQPTNLTAKAIDNLNVDLTWVDNSAVEDGYELLRSTGTQTQAVIVKLPAGATGYRDTGLSGNITYQYQVRATKDGGTSSPSEIARAALALLPPAAPTGARALPNTSRGIGILWTNQSSNADGFHIERSTDGGISWVFAVDGDPVWSPTFGVNDWDRTPEREVCYRVIAYNLAGESSPSNTACTTPPAAPTNLVQTQVDAQTFDLQWTDNSQVEDGYELLAFGLLGDWFPIASLPPNSTSFRFSLDMIPPGYAGPGVAATKDGGYSDFVFLPEVTGAALQALSKTAVRPPASAQRTPPKIRTR
jgi:hypothetical protein